MTVAQLSRLLEQAGAARKKNENERAFELYQKVLEQTDDKTADSAIASLRFTAYQQSGLLHFYLGNYATAMQQYQRAYQEAANEQQRIIALTFIADVYRESGEYDKADSTYQEALKLAEMFHYENGRAAALRGLGQVNYHLGRPEDSLKFFQKSRALFIQLQDIEGHVRTANGIGVAHMDLGQLDKAIASFQEGLRLRRRIEGRTIAFCLSNLGECYQNLFDMEQALAYHMEAWELAQKLQLPFVEPDLARNLGVDLCYVGRIEEGIRYLYHALAKCQEIAQQEIELQTLYSLAQAEMQRREWETARQHGLTLYREAERSKARSHLAKAYYVFGLFAQHEGDKLTAEQMWQHASFLAHETHQYALLWEIHAGLAQIASNPALAKTHYRIAADVIEQIVYPIEDAELRQKFLNATPVQTILQQVKG